MRAPLSLQERTKRNEHHLKNVSERLGFIQTRLDNIEAKISSGNSVRMWIGIGLGIKAVLDGVHLDSDTIKTIIHALVGGG